MENALKKHKFLMGTAGYAALVALAVYFLISPFIREIETKSTEIQKKNIDNEIIRKKISDIPRAESQLLSLSEKEGKLDIFFKADDEAGFIREFESLAENTGNLIVLKIEDEKKERVVKKTDGSEKKSIKDSLPSPDYILVKISLQGGYGELLNFINKLENMKRYANILSVNVSLDDFADKNFSVNDGVFFNSRSGNGEKEKKNADEKKLKSELEVAVYIEK